MQECLSTSRGALNAHPVMIIHQAAPVEKVQHGLKAEDGLLCHARVVREHGISGSQLDRNVCFCPSNLLQPCLHHAGTEIFSGQKDHMQIFSFTLDCLNFVDT